MPPSWADFVACGARNYSFGIIITHEGKIYKYSSGKIPFKSYQIDLYIEKYINNGYNHDDSYFLVYKEMQRKGYEINCELIE